MLGACETETQCFVKYPRVIWDFYERPMKLCNDAVPGPRSPGQDSSSSSSRTYSSIYAEEKWQYQQTNYPLLTFTLSEYCPIF